MAFGAKQIFPNDTKPRVAIGVDIPFTGNSAHSMEPGYGRTAGGLTSCRYQNISLCRRPSGDG